MDSGLQVPGANPAELQAQGGQGVPPRAPPGLPREAGDAEAGRGGLAGVTIG